MCPICKDVEIGWEAENAIRLPLSTKYIQAHPHRFWKVKLQNDCKQTHSPTERNGKICLWWNHPAKGIKLISTNSCRSLLIAEHAQPNLPPLRLITWPISSYPWNLQCTVSSFRMWLVTQDSLYISRKAQIWKAVEKK